MHPLRPSRPVRRALFTAVAVGMALAAFTQTCAAQSANSGTAPTLGKGAGYHDPRSPFKPLQEKDGVLSWTLLSSVTSKADRSRVIPIFPANVLALDKQTVRIQGFMLPLEPGDRQKHFLLSAVPTSCAFCVPAGPEGLVEVFTKAPVKYTLEPVVVEGPLSVLKQDPYGMYYRVTDAQAVN